MLPNLIEIVPLPGTVSAAITVPGSKSITNRALILAALGRWRNHLARRALERGHADHGRGPAGLGFDIAVEPDDREICNRTIRVRGLGGKIPNGGTPANRWSFLSATPAPPRGFWRRWFVWATAFIGCAAPTACTNARKPALFHALRELGYRIESANDRLPANILGAGPREGGLPCVDRGKLAIRLRPAPLRRGRPMEAKTGRRCRRKKPLTWP